MNTQMRKYIQEIIVFRIFGTLHFSNILLHATQTNSNFPPLNQSNTNFLLLSTNYTCTQFFTLIFIALCC